MPLPPERIAELRETIEAARNICAGLPDGYRGGLPDHVAVPHWELDALLAECERMEKITELLSVRGTSIISTSAVVRIACPEEGQAGALHGLFEALTPPQQAGAP